MSLSLMRSLSDYDKCSLLVFWWEFYFSTFFVVSEVFLPVFPGVELEARLRALRARGILAAPCTLAESFLLLRGVFSRKQTHKT